MIYAVRDIVSGRKITLASHRIHHQIKLDRPAFGPDRGRAGAIPEPESAAGKRMGRLRRRRRWLALLSAQCDQQVQRESARDGVELSAGVRGLQSYRRG